MAGTHPVVKLSAGLMQILRCPVTGQVLHQKGAELVTGAAGTGVVQLRYPIEEGIPVLLPGSGSAPTDS